MTDSRVQLLADASPAWFQRSSGPDPLVGRARAPDTKWELDGLLIRIWIDSFGRLRVGEDVPGTRLPKRCAERHIQGDETFCLGLNALPVTDPDEAAVWWLRLGQYLQLQSIADTYRFWPAGHSRDHGDAGESHDRAIELATRLGLLSEYEAAHDDEPSWIADPSLHLIDREGKPIIGRAPCPLDCRHRRKPMRGIHRRKCKFRGEIIKLVRLEARRRAQLADYWEAERNAGAACCQTMDRCPLRDPPQVARGTTNGSVRKSSPSGCELANGAVQLCGVL